jgi:enoyl-[acyl-carrier protein] reductase II
MFQTKLCDLLGIKYPIIQGALTGIRGGPGLAAAVSNAGGLGILATFNKTSKQLQQQIAQIRDLTDKPFGLNIIAGNANFVHRVAEVAVNQGVTIVTTGRGDPGQTTISLLKGHGITVLPVVPTVRHAVQVELKGADAVIASGMEAGGHVGTIGSLPLIPQVVDAVNIPVVAAGGIGDARGFLAALVLGACGVQLGTRFLASLESEASLKQKQKIVDALGEDTITTSIFSGKNARVIKTPELEEWLQRQREGAKPTELKVLVKRILEKHRNSPESNVAAGQVSGMIKKVDSVRDIIGQIIDEASSICRSLNLMVIME